jgi:hypothetical protein
MRSMPAVAKKAAARRRKSAQVAALSSPIGRTEQGLEQMRPPRPSPPHARSTDRRRGSSAQPLAWTSWPGSYSPAKPPMMRRHAPRVPTAPAPAPDFEPIIQGSLPPLPQKVQVEPTAGEGVRIEDDRAQTVTDRFRKWWVFAGGHETDGIRAVDGANCHIARWGSGPGAQPLHAPQAMLARHSGAPGPAQSAGAHTTAAGCRPGRGTALPRADRRKARRALGGALHHRCSRTDV